MKKAKQLPVAAGLKPEINVNNEPKLLEISISNPKSREIVTAYIRDNSVTVVKERDGSVLRSATFGSGCLQVMREWLLLAEPPNLEQIYNNTESNYERITGGNKQRS